MGEKKERNKQKEGKKRKIIFGVLNKIEKQAVAVAAAAEKGEEKIN